MSQMATTPVYKCRRCGTPVAAHLQTKVDDPDSALLIDLMQGLHKIALCKSCLREYNHFASQNRADEFWKRANPEVVILTVNDNSGLDYYRRKG